MSVRWNSGPRIIRRLEKLCGKLVMEGKRDGGPSKQAMKDARDMLVLHQRRQDKERRQIAFVKKWKSQARQCKDDLYVCRRRIAILTGDLRQSDRINEAIESEKKITQELVTIIAKDSLARTALEQCADQLSQSICSKLIDVLRVSVKETDPAGKKLHVAFVLDQTTFDVVVDKPEGQSKGLNDGQQTTSD